MHGKANKGMALEVPLLRRSRGLHRMVLRRRYPKMGCPARSLPNLRQRPAFEAVPPALGASLIRASKLGRLPYKPALPRYCCVTAQRIS